MNKFFIDSAKIGVVSKVLTSLKERDQVYRVEGITTNPKALKSAGVTNFQELEVVLRNLCETLETTVPNRKIYVQIPSSQVSFYDALKFVDRIGDMKLPCRVGFKVPPNIPLIERLHQIGCSDLNVTGLTECLTANQCLEKRVRYVSILFGRLEEEGVNVSDHIKKISDPELVISGSMRTFEGLAKTIKLGTVPTIGERVWNEIFNGRFDEFDSLTPDKPSQGNFPIFDQKCFDVAKIFWSEMDGFGKDLYSELLSSKNPER
jgi:hypothetical protein